MKIVTYNVNGLRQRISQFGSLLKLLNSFDSDIICFQETKLRRQELTADVVMADGYESFFSCTRTSDKGRLGYSGVATFCRVNSAFSSNEAALPVSAEEGFSGLLQNNKKDELPATVTAGLEDFEKDELLQIDSEGRCIITDHGHFILFNLYGPRAESDDTERIQFKLKFFKILQKRWEHLLRQGRRIFVVGDLNIAPAAIDRCDAGPDFEKNEFRTWLRSMTVPGGGPFFDVFRAMHPDRKDAYTCWPSNTGAEQFNFGSRIDHILSSGSCLHENWEDSQDHNFIGCHVMECDILTQYKRWRPENALRWKGGWSTKLEGSDHAPVYVSLMEITDIAKHDTPSLSTRYFPMIRGLQQTIVSLLTKRQVSEQVEVCDASNSSSAERITMSGCSSCSKRSYSECNVLEQSEHFSREVQPTSLQNTGADFKKKTRKGQSSQLSLTSFFQKSPNCSERPENPSSDLDDEYRKSSNDIQQDDPMPSNSSQDQDELIISCSSEKDRNSMALLQWQRIQQLMQDKIPLCKGHKEPCVSRIVKKAGPNFGRRFYTCARAEGPSSNPEANCGFFKWSGSKSKQK